MGSLDGPGGGGYVFLRARLWGAPPGVYAPVSLHYDRDGNPRSRWLQAFGLAVLLHLAVLPLLERFLPEAPPPGKGKPIRIVSLPAKVPPRQQPKRPESTRKEDKKEPKEEEKKKEDKLVGQIVDVPPTLDDEAPEDAKYLSEHNTKTERETKSRHQTKDYNVAMNEVTRADKQETTAPTKPKESTQVEIGPEKPREVRDQKVAGSQKAFELPDIQQRDRLALEMNPELGKHRNRSHSEALRGNSNRLKLDLGEEEAKPEEKGSAPKQGTPNLDLIPSVGVLAQINGAPANDHLEALEEGEGTFLNSREFKYASFFNRMKRGVSQHWRPLQEYRRRDPTGNIYGQKPRVTVLKVVLTPQGDIDSIAVTRSSGVDFLDAEAIAAFHAASPFPNPPKGLVNSDGLIDFPFGFHIEFGRGGFRLPF